MPKQKTKRAAAKRLSFTGSGKITHHKAFGAHILTKKDPGRKRKLRKTPVISAADRRNGLRMLPNR